MHHKEIKIALCLSFALSLQAADDNNTYFFQYGREHAQANTSFVSSDEDSYADSSEDYTSSSDEDSEDEHHGLVPNSSRKRVYARKTKGQLFDESIQALAPDIIAAQARGEMTFEEAADQIRRRVNAQTETHARRRLFPN